MRAPRGYWPDPRKLLIILHDLTVTALALLAALYVRLDYWGLEERSAWLMLIMPAFVAYAGGVYYAFRLYESKWRFASLPDLWNIFRAVTILTVSLIALDYSLVFSYAYGSIFFGKITIALYWFFQIFFLGAPRIAYRYFRYTRTLRSTQGQETNLSFVLGRAADAEMVLRAFESGAIRHAWPVGILSPSKADQRTVVRNVRVLGTFEDLERAVGDFGRDGSRVKSLILTSSALALDAHPEGILQKARELGLDVRYLSGLEETRDLNPRALRLSRLDVEDLLLRPSVKIDYGRLEKFVRGRAVVVTGGGGSIGSEICGRMVTFGAVRLLVLENSEPALAAVLETLRASQTGAVIRGRICDVRDRERVFRLLQEFKPDIVFHAAALKQVPMVEEEWSEAVKTNVFGSMNVADATVAAGAEVMVMISTDKAIEPRSVLGATKRLAEMYCQALDNELSARSSGTHPVVSITRRSAPTRLISVRFGNVLASNGSVVPKFKAQIEAGGPVTVTDANMVRYFMTVREACDLVVTAASHASASNPDEASVYVLNMGQPVRIVDLAERMIRIAGYEPNHEIEIRFTGMRPGERLEEILFAHDEPIAEIGINGIVAAKPAYRPLPVLRVSFAELETSLQQEDRSAVFRVFHEAVPDFKGEAA